MMKKMSQIKLEFNDPDFFKYNSKQLISKEDLDLLLNNSSLYQSAKDKHGSIFIDYITTHYNQRGYNVVENGAFFEHLERTDPSLVNDILKMRAELYKAWHLQAYLHKKYHPDMKPGDFEKLLNVDHIDESRTHLDQQPKIIEIDDIDLLSSSPPASPLDRSFNLTNPLEPEFLNLDILFDFISNSLVNLFLTLLILFAFLSALQNLYKNHLTITFQISLFLLYPFWVLFNSIS